MRMHIEGHSGNLHTAIDIDWRAPSLDAALAAIHWALPEQAPVLRAEHS